MLMGKEMKAFRESEMPSTKVRCGVCNDTGFDQMGDGIAGECLYCEKE